MGSSSPKWKIKQKRAKVVAARRALRDGTKKPSPTGIRRVGRH